MKFPGAATTNKIQSRQKTQGVAGSLGRPQPLLWIAALIFFVICWTFSPSISAQVTAPDFTVVVFPDPQNETQFFPQVLNSQMQWIVNNRQAQNIQMVLTVGDNINDGASTAQMQNLDAAFRLLDNAGIPYLPAIGNHDYNGFNPKVSRDLSGFNQRFGPGRYAGKAFFKGNFPAGSNANSYAVVTINGQQFLFLNLEFRPTSASLDWAESILSANPDKEAIVVSHAFLQKAGNREDKCDDQDMPAGNATGQETWTRLRKHANVIMVLSGHFTSGPASRRSDVGDNKNLVNQLFADYQSFPNGGNGWLRILTFHPTSNTISVRTFSPFLNQSMTDALNQFTIIHHNNFPNSGTGSIAGKVRRQSTCAAIAGIKVSAGSASTTSATDGTYRLSLPPGSHSVTASGAGWNTSTRSETVSDSLSTQMNFYLSTSASPTPTPTPTPPPSGCTAGAIGVTVCSPAPGATVASPVHFTAAAKSTHPITAMRIYVDNVSNFSTNASSLNTSLALATGTHSVVVQAWDSTGVVFKTPLTIHVQ
jgi:Carboxypeptidase regulatory-like domain/Calcineurin-like phosphoesterase/Bacterial Ig domain